MRHAFLIIAHANYPLVSRLLKKIDHPDNTIYIHIDSKSVFSEEDERLLVNSCRHSKVNFVERYRVNWGGYSQINTEMRMMECASHSEYDYYHILSGVDFPTKSMEYIHEFFEKNAGYEFVHFCSDEFNEKNAYKYSRYHFFQEKCDRNNNIYLMAKRALLLLQKLLKVNRAKKYKNINFKGGSNWVSVTHEFVIYLLSKESLIKKLFSRSFCCDEFFLQTILYDSPFKDKIFCLSQDKEVLSNMRSVDWERGDHKIGAPYTYTIEDYEDLVNSKNLFCRKITDATPQGEALVEKLEHL